MLVTITEFAESRDTDRDTVNAFIRNHPEIKAQTQREGKHVVIDTDSEAYSLLDKQYPLPKLVQVIEDTESREKLIKAHEAIIQLQQKLAEQTQLIAQAEATKLLLEDKQEQLAQAHSRLDRAEAENAELRKTLEEERQKLADERAKSWWQKLRGK